MEYHPGGEEELMKAAGADGTELFDQVHRWVNYESMLKECLVGRMAVKLVTCKEKLFILLLHKTLKENNGRVPVALEDPAAVAVTAAVTVSSGFPGSFLLALNSGVFYE